MHQEAKKMLRDILDALNADLENGVAWMNDAAWEKHNKEYPCLSNELEKYLDMELEDYE